ncbi:MAG: hypothetical protein Q6353_007420 [Candidatus Sigynarchaeum springense]
MTTLTENECPPRVRFSFPVSRRAWQRGPGRASHVHFLDNFFSNPRPQAKK